MSGLFCFSSHPFSNGTVFPGWEARSSENFQPGFKEEDDVLVSRCPLSCITMRFFQRQTQGEIKDW